MRLNLGCGRRPLTGFVNIDRHPGPGVDLVLDLGREPFPFPPESIDEVVSSHFLEHVSDFGFLLSEVHRVLKYVPASKFAVGGTFTNTVPYGRDFNPFHVRAFTERSLGFIVKPDGCLDSGDWSLVSVRILNSGFPGWHLQRYFGLSLPFGRREMAFVLRKETRR